MNAKSERNIRLAIGTGYGLGVLGSAARHGFAASDRLPSRRASHWSLGRDDCWPPPHRPVLALLTHTVPTLDVFPREANFRVRMQNLEVRWQVPEFLLKPPASSLTPPAELQPPQAQAPLRPYLVALPGPLFQRFSAPLPTLWHGSGSGWFATPFLYDSFIHYFTPVYPDAIQAKGLSHKDYWRS